MAAPLLGLYEESPVLLILAATRDSERVALRFGNVANRLQFHARAAL